MNLLESTPHGLYCERGDFYVDPWHPVPRAVVTHAHSDHARWGCGHYLAAKEGRGIFRLRLGLDAAIDFVRFGETRTIGDVRVSLHPAGHMTGSAQVRIEHQGQVWVVTGDYKLQSDPTCASFEPVRCHTLITESTFGLPIFRWDKPDTVFAAINRWWLQNQAVGSTSVLYGYTVGKAQRLLSGIDSSIGPIVGHGAILNACRAYAESGVELPPVRGVSEFASGTDWSQSLVVAPPSAHGTPWLRRFGKVSTAMASGWMRVRGIRRRRAMDRGFVISDHVDWPDLMQAIELSQAENIWVTHGYVPQVVRHLRSQGWNAQAIATQFRGELEIEAADETDADSQQAASQSENPNVTAAEHEAES
ncbi:MAG: ligase-associated DNA damage response exonuclease [Planctomycetaceae bacterium]